jgi:hypothetical protein
MQFRPSRMDSPLRMLAYLTTMYLRSPTAFLDPLWKTYPLPKNHRKTLQNPAFQPLYKPFALI